MSEMNRRAFVAVATAACAACVCGSAGEALGAEEIKPVDAGALSDFGQEGIYDQFAKDHKFYLIRKGDRLYAAAAVCTHKSFLVTVDSESKKELRCTKHGSRFDSAGIVLKGPAKRALPRLGIKLDERNRVIVDPSQQFEEKQWNKAGSSIKVARNVE